MKKNKSAIIQFEKFGVCFTLRWIINRYAHGSINLIQFFGWKKSKKLKTKRKKEIFELARYATIRFHQNFGWKYKNSKNRQKTAGSRQPVFHWFSECTCNGEYKYTIKSHCRLFAVFDGFLTLDFIANSRYKHYRDYK